MTLMLMTIFQSSCQKLVHLYTKNQRDGDYIQQIEIYFACVVSNHWLIQLVSKVKQICFQHQYCMLPKTILQSSINIKELKQTMVWRQLKKATSEHKNVHDNIIWGRHIRITIARQKARPTVQQNKFASCRKCVSYMNSWLSITIGAFKGNEKS